MILQEKLEWLFPFARRIDILVPAQGDGSFVAQLRAPMRAGESVIQVYRYPANAELDASGDLPYEDRLTWPAPFNKLSFGHGDRWAFFASWDGVASKDEVRELVSKRLAGSELLGTDTAP